ncbi:MAG: glycosyltransferase [Bacteroidales bacterium]|nr:glycosyltransferase [Bacteroidales bacterium]
MENIHYFIWFFRLTEVLAGMYLILIGVYTIGWYQTKRQPVERLTDWPFFSVLIAVRNEAAAIEELLNSLLHQNYPAANFEVILVDDHSDDDTIFLVQQFIKQNKTQHFKLINANSSGKKAALRQALALSEGKYIAVTDGDCVLKPDWLLAFANYFKETEAKLLLAPVLLQPVNTLLEKLQLVEFLSLMGSTGGAASVGFPVMGNGANMAYERLAALEVEKYRTDGSLTSGDDVFLMETIRSFYGAKAVKFIRHQAAVVSTRPQPDLKSFFAQRMRWVSKNRNYRSIFIILPALVVLGFNLSLFLMLFFGIFYPLTALFFILFLGLKILIDLPLLTASATFFYQRKLLFLVFPLAFVYPIYVVISGVGGLFFKVNWKGRRI